MDEQNDTRPLTERVGWFAIPRLSGFRWWHRRIGRPYEAFVNVGGWRSLGRCFTRKGGVKRVSQFWGRASLWTGVEPDGGSR